MTWSKISDDFSDDCWTLSDKAWRLHVEGLIWSNRKLLDLVIPKDELRLFAKHPEALGELVMSGYWEEDGLNVTILHHGSYQRLKANVIAQQVANTANQARRGIVTPPPREIVEKPKSLVFAVSKESNKSSNKSLNDSTNERDRTGRLLGKDTNKVETTYDWPAVAIPGKDYKDGDVF
jgi:hypothetical protein